MLSLEDDANRKQAIKELKKTLKEKDDSAFDDSEIGKSLIGYAVDMTTIISNISGLISPSNVFLKALASLFQKADLMQ